MNNSGQIGKRFLLLCKSTDWWILLFSPVFLDFNMFFDFIGTVGDGTTSESLQTILEIRESRKKEGM